MSITHVFAGIPTADFTRALAWYEDFFGRAPDRFAREDEAVWQLADTGLVYRVADDARAGRALVALIVDDLQQRIAELARRGIETDAIDTVSGMLRTKLTDPDGNTITVGQPVRVSD